jgi:hypothetical protein
MFKYPHVGPIWAAYLKTFVERYKGTKLERARDLFESALQGKGLRFRCQVPDPGCMVNLW